MISISRDWVILKLSIFTAWFWVIIEKYLLVDWHFVALIFVLVLSDTVIGTTWAIKSKTFSSKYMKNLPIKITIIFFSLIPAHAVKVYYGPKIDFEIFKFLIEYFDSTLYGWIVIRELLSIDENLRKFGYFIIPSIISSKIRNKMQEEFKNEK